MRAGFSLVTASILTVCGLSAQVKPTPTAPAVPLTKLLDQARTRTGAPNIPLGGDAGQTPNYVRALASKPAAMEPLQKLVDTVLFRGAIAPEIKMGMAARIAEGTGSSYLAAHAARWLRASNTGRAMLDRLQTSGKKLAPAEELALEFARLSTSAVHGVTNEQFRATRGYYNDSQVVELQMTTCFFNYLARFVEGLRLPVEPWALNTPYQPPASAYEAPFARVGLISNGMIEALAGRGGRGGQINMVNSQRAMNLTPEIAAAWRAYGLGRNGGEVSREIMLHVSFAVSMSNGCRYCTLHQVQGLRRLNVSPTKLMQMKKDDSALTPQELAAVVFARKVTVNPSGVTNADWQALRKEFTENGALEVLMQTCNFAFMNRFTDGLRLPSEDEAIRIYRETYGNDFGPVGEEIARR